MIRIVVVDDHPSLRAGLATVLAAEPDIVPVGEAGGAQELMPLLNTTRPDLVLLDYHLPGTDGLQICRRIKSEALAPRVILYSAYAGSELAVPALLAGADGVIGKNIPARELCEAIRSVAGGARALPPVPQQLLTEAGSQLDPEDLPILGMVMDGTPIAEIQTTLGEDRTGLNRRIDRMIARLRVEVPVSGA